MIVKSVPSSEAQQLRESKVYLDACVVQKQHSLTCTRAALANTQALRTPSIKLEDHVLERKTSQH